MLPQTGSKEQYTSFDSFKVTDFNLKELSNLEKEINKKDENINDF